MTLELALIEASIAVFDPEPGEADAILPLVHGMNAEFALQTLRLHKSAQPWRSGPRPSDPETARAAILRQVAIVQRGAAARARRRAISRQKTNDETNAFNPRSRPSVHDVLRQPAV